MVSTIKDTLGFDQKIIDTLVQQLRALPEEALTKLQYLQPQVGCFNRCIFCSQHAGRDVWQFTLSGLKNFIAALAQLLQEKKVESHLVVAAGRNSHRPNTLFPYFDNDVFSYEHLEEYIRLVWETLSTKVRISTVGYSVQNSELQAMHEQICKNLSQAIAGIRFSFTPYTLGWTQWGEVHGKTSRRQFISDFANALKTYRPLTDTLGIGKETACVELRFAPHMEVFESQIDEEYIDGHHVIRSGPHLLINQNADDSPPEITHIQKIEGKTPVFSTLGKNYFLYTSDDIIRSYQWRKFVLELLVSDLRLIENSREVCLFAFKNLGGFYYAADPEFSSDGRFCALHIYPKTNTRKVSGYLDATRYFMNTMFQFKKAYGMKFKEEFPQANWHDVAKFLRALKVLGRNLQRTDMSSAFYLVQEVLPLVKSYAVALYRAEYPAAYFFHPAFTIDTGIIVNQGRANPLFSGLATHHNDPLTPHEERGYGDTSISSERGYVWRIAPMPFVPENSQPLRSIIGGKNRANSTASIVVQELDPRHLLPFNKTTGECLRQFTITGVDLEHITLKEGYEKQAFPGILSESNQ